MSFDPGCFEPCFDPVFLFRFSPRRSEVPTVGGHPPDTGRAPDDKTGNRVELHCSTRRSKAPVEFGET
jgi:hypothetical protein